MADASTARSPVTAIDIVLAPDQTMIGRAKTANAALLRIFPKGFALDATHHPHISIFAGFVPDADLPEVYEIAGDVLAMDDYAAWRLTAFKYDYVPIGPIGLGGIVVRPTPDLVRLRETLIGAIGPCTVKTATAAAFYTTRAEPDIHPSVIDHIAASMTEINGANFSPHVTIGLGATEFLDAMIAEPFRQFAFSPVSAAVYQLGDFGTSRKLLKALPADCAAKQS
jgi:hypothetical protein